MFKKTAIAIFVFTLSLAPLWAITPDQLQQLAGRSTDSIPTSQYAKIYQDAFSHLTGQMDKTTSDTRYAHQIMLQEICLHASRPNAEKQRLAMSKALTATLQSKTMTPEIRYWVLLQIQRVGKTEVLDVLTNSLGSTDRIEQGYARAALEKNPDPQAAKILLTALANTRDQTFAAGLISSLGNKQDPLAVQVIAKKIDNTNRTVAAAAVTAMVKINTPDAVTILKQKLSPAHPAAADIAKALLEIAAISTPRKANAIYNELYAYSGKVKPPSNAYNIRKAALIGLAENNARGINKKIKTAFKAKDPALRSMAIAAAAITKSSRPAKNMADNSSQLDNVLQSRLIVMLAKRNESSVMKPVKHAIKSDDPLLLHLVIDILSQQNTQEALEMLLETTNNSDVKIRKYANQKVIATADRRIDKLLLTKAARGDDKQRAAAIALIGERKTPNITELLFEYSKPDNESIYKAALKAIGASASINEIPILCGMVKTSKTDTYKKSALLAINMILINSQDKKTAYAIIIKEIKSTDDDQKPDLLTTLKRCQDPDTMQYCLDLLDDAEGDAFQTPIPQTALKMLTYFADPMPAKHLLDRAKTSKHRSAYAQAALNLAKNMLRYSKTQAKNIAKDVKALNISPTINKNADQIINIRGR